MSLDANNLPVSINLTHRVTQGTQVLRISEGTLAYAALYGLLAPGAESMGARGRCRLISTLLVPGLRINE
jgi:hypothetical protein